MIALITGATSGFGKSTAEIFAKNGYDVIITGRRKERLAELKQKIDATEELRRKNIPFVFLTTNSDQKIINEVFRMNVQGYFVKPSTLQAILETLRMILNYWTLCRHPTAWT